MRPKNRPIATKMLPAPTSLLLKVIVSPLRRNRRRDGDVAPARLPKQMISRRNAGSFDQRLPARDFRLYLGLERVRRGVLFRLRARGKGGEALDDIRVLEGHLQRLAQAVNDRSVGSGRCIKAVPDTKLHRGEAAFCCSWK